MNEKNRPKTALAILLGLCAFSCFLLYFSIHIPGLSLRGNKEETFTIIQRHYGIDAAEMERTIAIPLENALSGIRGLKRIRSVSENASVRVFAVFSGEKSGGFYEAVREAAQEVYKTLPSSAQRPEILPADDSRLPVWTAVVSVPEKGSADESPSPAFLGTILEKTIQPALKALEGVGEVEISGAAEMETIIDIDAQKAAALGLGPQDIAASLAYNDALFSGGGINLGGREISIVLDGRYSDIEELKKALIFFQNEETKNFIRLEDIASVRENEKENQSLSRLNGKKAAVIAIMAGGANLAKLSRLIKNEIKKFGELEFTVLSDRGEEEAAAYRSVLGAAIQGSAAVALITVLLCYKKRRGTFVLMAAISVPVILLFSSALLRVFGFELDTMILAGLAAGGGAAVDAVIISAEYLGRASNMEERREALAALRFPLVSGSATTIIALLPLALQKQAAVFNASAWAIASVNLVSMVLALSLFPPLFLAKPRKTKRQKTLPENKDHFSKDAAPERPLRLKSLLKRFTLKPRFPSRGLSRLLAFHVHFCVKRPLAVIVFWFIIAALGILALAAGGVDTGAQGSGESVYAQVEFDGGLHIEEVDRRLASFGEALKNRAGVLNVQTSARTGSGSVLLTFNPKMINPQAAKKLLRSNPVNEGFVYIAESSGGERIWEIRISGDDEKHCRELAAEAARLCSDLPHIEETVLNFKNGRTRLTLKADRERLAEAGLSFSRAGSVLRYGVHGPVGYKRRGADGETDVRFIWKNMAENTNENSRSGREAVLQTTIPPSAAPAGIFFIESEDHEPSSIHRLDRRRSASISLRTKTADPEKIKAGLLPVLSKLELPPGYYLEFDPGAIQTSKKIRSLSILFVLALVLCYIIIAASRESFLLPFAVLSVVPPSLAFPALWTFAAGLPLNAAAASAFIAVSGMAVNAAVLVAESVLSRRNPVRALGLFQVLKKQLPLLAATSLTTIAGVVPFLFIDNNSAPAIKILSVTAALGVGGSSFCSLSLIPALAAFAPGLFKQVKL